MTNIKRWIYTSDWHIPYLCSGFYDWFLDQVRHYKPDIVVLGGDQLDAVVLSKYSHSAEDTTPLHEDYAQLNDSLHGARVACQNEGKDTEFVFLLGNHEDRIEQAWISKNLRPLLHWNAHQETILPELKHWKQVPYAVYRKNNRHRVGQVTWIHGWEVAKNKLNAQAVEQGVENGLVVSGHIHRADENVVQLEAFGDCMLPYYRVSCGMGMAYENAEYMRAKRQLMVNWTQSIVVGEVKATKSPRRAKDWDAHPVFYSVAHRGNRCGINNRSVA